MLPLELLKHIRSEHIGIASSCLDKRWIASKVHLNVGSRQVLQVTHHVIQVAEQIVEINTPWPTIHVHKCVASTEVELEVL